jgi:hypothetical protein
MFIYNMLSMLIWLLLWIIIALDNKIIIMDGKYIKIFAKFLKSLNYVLTEQAFIYVYTHIRMLLRTKNPLNLILRYYYYLQFAVTFTDSSMI